VHVDQVWRYPVKSMHGSTVDAMELAPDGFVGDRQWVVRDEERAGLRSGRQLPALARCRAEYVADTPGAVRITLPDGATVTTDDAGVNATLSAAFGRPVTIWSRRPASDLAHYRSGAPESTDLMTELRAIFAREADEPLPDFSVFPPELGEFSSPPGQYYDCWPLMIMSTSALAALRAAVPDSVVDVRRFRPSLVVHTGAAVGHPEFAWRGRRARLGDAEIEFLAPCPRCAMITRELGPDVPQDRAILRHVVRDLDQAVGIYAKVVRPGRISVGDALELV